MTTFCELCGRQIIDGKKAVIIDGTILNVCTPCSKHGKPYLSTGVTKEKTTNTSAPKKIKMNSSKIQMKEDTILTSDFPKLIREARMKKGLTHDQLGMQMNEKVTLLKKFETGVLKPDEIFAKKLERFLGIKLYITPDEER
jgi:putative transcription factor